MLGSREHSIKSQSDDLRCFSPVQFVGHKRFSYRLNSFLRLVSEVLRKSKAIQDGVNTLPFVLELQEASKNTLEKRKVMAG